MPNSEQFDELLKHALQSQPLPPIPDGILNAWRPAPSNKGMKWLWIMPGVVFVFGIGIGVWLAPLGLSNAFLALKDTMFGIWHGVPMATFAWAASVLLAVAVFSIDSLRGHLTRFK